VVALRRWLLGGVIGLLAASAPAPARARPLTAQVFLTKANLRYALSEEKPITFSAKPISDATVLHVDDASRYQRIGGFGGTMTDSAAWLIYRQVPVRARAALMGRLFSRSGIHLSFVRIPVGASDFSAGGRPYSYDDVRTGSADPTLSHFSIAHDLAYTIPVLRQMRSINPGVWIMASPWSPPPWMKANDAFDDLEGAGTLLPTSYGAWAAYLVRFLRAYRSHGVAVNALTPQNEPGSYAAFPALNLSMEDEAILVHGYLVPALRAAGIHPAIWGLDRGALLDEAQELLQSEAAADLTGIAWHCYGGPGPMQVIQHEYPALRQLVSECAPGLIPYQPAEAVISATRNGASSVALWSLALDPAGGPVQPPNTGCPRCVGLVTISERTHRVRYGLGYYQLGQISRFVHRGAVRIGSDRWVSDYNVSGHYGVTPGIDNVAFLNPDGSKVLVAYNNSDARIRFAVGWRGRGFVYTLAGRATATFVWR